MSDLITVEVVQDEPVGAYCPDSYDYMRLPEELRDQAMLAQGTVLTKLNGAVERVIDAGNTLRWAKETLPHGEYLPWVQQACGLKPQHATKLIKAAEWVSNVALAQRLDGVADTTTLFLLSADTTAEDVRQWFLERCAAGDPPSRKEVQERKRNGTSGGRERTLVQEAMSALKLSPEARALAAAAEQISTRQLMDDLGVDELPKGNQYQTDAATYCRNSQSGWWKFPIIQAPIPLPEEQTQPQELTSETVPLLAAAERIGISVGYVKFLLSPKQIRKAGYFRKNGLEIRPHPKRGLCSLISTGA